MGELQAVPGTNIRPGGLQEVGIAATGGPGSRKLSALKGMAGTWDLTQSHNQNSKSVKFHVKSIKNP